MKDQVRTLFGQGKSISSIALALGMSRNTVRKYVAAHQPSENRQETADEPSSRSWQDGMDWDRLAKLVAKGVTIKQLFRESAPETVSYWAFRRALMRALGPRKDVISVRQEHEPAKATQIDFADGLSYFDPASGKTVSTQLFCGVLPFSSLIYAEFVADQKSANFLGAQARMWRALGGVTPYVVIDNLKSGVKRAHRYDPDLNPTYCDFANHFGFAVLPARPYHPKDKACVEASIGVLQRTFYQQVRERRFYSLRELNMALALFLKELNAQQMKDHGVSRDERFEAERPHLLPLPSQDFEICEHRMAKVHPDCCIQIQKSFYSVPHVFAGQTVRVKITPRIVMIFNDSLELIAQHPRSSKVGGSSIEPDHYPDHKMQLTRYEVGQCRRVAKDIGPKTSALVEHLFNDSRPLRHLRRVQGIVRLYDRGQLTREGLEYAASQAMTFRRYRLAYIEDCAKSFERNRKPRMTSAPMRALDEVYLHHPERDTNDDRATEETSALTETHGYDDEYRTPFGQLPRA